VDGQPAVGAVPDGSANDGAAAHRVATQVVVQRVTAQHAGFAEVAELTVADGAGGVAVVHRVAAFPFRIGRLDNDVPTQVGHLAAVETCPQVLVLQRGA